MLSQKAYNTGLQPETVLTGRYIIGTCLVWIYIFLTKKKVAIGRKNILLLFLVGVNIFVCVFCMTSSYYYLPGAIASLIVFSYIILVNIFELLTGRIKPRVILFVCLICTLIGLVLVVYVPSGSHIKLSMTGIILALIAGILYSVWAISMGARTFDSFSPEVMMGFSLIIPAICNIVKCIIAGEPVFPETIEQWVYIGLLGISPGFIAPISFSNAIRLIGPSKASIINTSEPVFAFFAGLLIMGDHLSFNAIIGGILIIVGIFILKLKGGND